MENVWVIYYDGNAYQQVVKSVSTEADLMDPVTFELDPISTIIAVLRGVTDGQAVVIGEETSYFSTGD